MLDFLSKKSVWSWRAERDPSTTKLLRVTPGFGKTREVIGLVRDKCVQNPDFRVFIYVPNHGLALELHDRIVEALANKVDEIGVHVWLGADQLCGNEKFRKRLQRAGVGLSSICSACPKKSDCDYPSQFSGQQIVILAGGGNIFGAVPEALRRTRHDDMTGRPVSIPPADLVIVDEIQLSGLLVSNHYRAAATLEPMAVPALLEPYFTKSGASKRENVLGTMFIEGVLSRLQNAAVAAEKEPQRLSPSMLIDIDALDPTLEGLAKGLRAAREALFDRTVPHQILHDTLVTVATGGAPHSVRRDLSELLRWNKSIKRLIEVFEALAQGVSDAIAHDTDPDDPLPQLSLSTAAKGHVQIALVYRGSVSRSHVYGDWRVPVIILDATADKEILEQFYGPIKQNINRVEDACPAAVRIYQVPSNGVYRDWTPPSAEADEDRQRRYASRADKLRALIDRELDKSAAEKARGIESEGVLLVAPMKTEESFIRAYGDNLPAGLTTMHFQALRGRDAARNVRSAIVVSRPLPPVRVLEQTARLIFGRPVEEIDGPLVKEPRWQEVTDPGLMDGRVETVTDENGIERHYVNIQTPVHPDPDVRRVQDMMTTAEVIQAVHRTRLIRRSTNQPVDVYIFSNVDIDRPVTAVLSTSEMLAQEHPLEPFCRSVGYVHPEDLDGLKAVSQTLELPRRQVAALTRAKGSKTHEKYKNAFKRHETDLRPFCVFLVKKTRKKELPTAENRQPWGRAEKRPLRLNKNSGELPFKTKRSKSRPPPTAAPTASDFCLLLHSRTATADELKTALERLDFHVIAVAEVPDGSPAGTGIFTRLLADGCVLDDTTSTREAARVLSAMTGEAVEKIRHEIRAEAGSWSMAVAAARRANWTEIVMTRDNDASITLLVRDPINHEQMAKEAVGEPPAASALPERPSTPGLAPEAPEPITWLDDPTREPTPRERREKLVELGLSEAKYQTRRKKVSKDAKYDPAAVDLSLNDKCLTAFVMAVEHEYGIPAHEAQAIVIACLRGEPFTLPQKKRRAKQEAAV